MEERKPRALLVPLTNVAADVVGLLPGQLEAPFINNCRDVRVVEGQLRAQCVVYGGKMEVTVAAADAPTILGVLPGARRADAARVEGKPSIEEVTVTVPEATRVQFKKYLEPEPGDLDLTQQ
jgi:electron transfer flavoprotein alpha subunit